MMREDPGGQGPGAAVGSGKAAKGDPADRAPPGGRGQISPSSTTPMSDPRPQTAYQRWELASLAQEPGHKVIDEAAAAAAAAEQLARELRSARETGLQQAPARRLIYIPTACMAIAGHGWTKRIRCVPTSARAGRRVAAEGHLRRFGRRTGCQPAAGRASMIRPSRLPLARLHKGDPVLVAEDDVFTNHIHADDLARLLALALFRGKPNRAYNATDDSQLRMGEYFDLVADAVGLPRPPRCPGPISSLLPLISRLGLPRTRCAPGPPWGRACRRRPASWGAALTSLSSVTVSFRTSSVNLAGGWGSRRRAPPSPARSSTRGGAEVSTAEPGRAPPAAASGSAPPAPPATSARVGSCTPSPRLVREGLGCEHAPLNAEAQLGGSWSGSPGRPRPRASARSGT